MVIEVLSAGAGQAALGPARLDPVELFLQADLIVQAVMVGLILASIWTWTIIVSFNLRMAKLRRKSRAYEDEFWTSKDREKALGKAQRGEVPAARVAGAGLDEWRRSTKAQPIDREATRQRISAAMEGQVAQEADDRSCETSYGLAALWALHSSNAACRACAFQSGAGATSRRAGLR